VADLVVGIDTDRVREVAQIERLTPVPMASSAVRGLINLRGQILPLLDLRSCLGLAPRPEGVQRHQVIVETADGLVAIDIDFPHTLVNRPMADLEPVTDPIGGVDTTLVRGMLTLDEHVLLVLDLGAILAVGFGGDPERSSDS